MQSGSDSCSLTIHSTFGFFYLGPLLALLLAPVILLISPSSGSGSATSSSSFASQQTLQDQKDASSKVEAAADGTAHGRVQVHPYKDGIASESTTTPKDSWSQAMLKAQERMNCDLYDDADCDQFDILRHCLAWWFALLVVMLIGCILAFSGVSSFWVL